MAAIDERVREMIYRGVLPLEEACLSLVGSLRHVAIDEARISSISEELLQNRPALPTWRDPAFPDEAGPQLDAVVWLGSAINFSYWVDPGERMWTVTLADGSERRDALAVFGAVHEALRDGIDLCDAPTLDSYAPALVDAGVGTLPMCEERIALLREIATIVELQFAGRLENAVAAAGGSAPEHARFLARTFPGFRDERQMGDRHLPFLKRAQLAAGMLHAARIARGTPGLEHTEQLSVYSDYMLPRTLRHLGALRYTPELGRRIDALEPIDPQSREEIELRVATVACGSLLRRAAELPPIALDHWLWRRGFEAAAPHHRTRTTDY